MKKEEYFLQLAEQFQRINNKIFQMRNNPVSFDGSVPLNAGAIHIIEAIGKNGEANITEIARILGITKGAVSQSATKLCAKGLIVKIKVGLNDKDVRLQLTTEGQKVFEGHEKLHAAMYTDLQSSLYDVTLVEIERVHIIFDKIENYMDYYQHEFK